MSELVNERLGERVVRFTWDVIRFGELSMVNSECRLTYDV